MQTILEQPKTEADMIKKCPFCAEEIQVEAIKCRFCGEFLNKPQHKGGKWYYSSTAIIVAFLFLGPLAIPLVWLNPRYNIVTRLLITAAMVGITILAAYAVTGLFNNVINQVHQLGIR